MGQNISYYEWIQKDNLTKVKNKDPYFPTDHFIPQEPQNPSPFPSYINVDHLRILRLKNCERVGRVDS